VEDYAHSNSPSIERPNRENRSETPNKSKVNSLEKTEQLNTISASGKRLSVELVALCVGRSIDHYLDGKVKELEGEMSLMGDKSFEQRLTAFIIVNNNGEKHKARNREFTLKTEDGYKYACGEDVVVGITSPHLKGSWKTTGWEISHGQTQYWTLISEPIPDDVTITKITYNNKREQFKLEIEEIREQLEQQNALAVE